MKKIAILLFVLLSKFTFAQNSVETNPNGTTAIISSKGTGSSLINNAKTGIYANSGNSTTNSEVRAIQGIASNSTNLNIGVYGFANGNTSNFNYAISGDAIVNTGTGVAFFGNSSTSSISADYLYGGQFNTAAYNGTNGGAIINGVTSNVYGSGAIAQRIGFNTIVEGSSSDGSTGVSSSVTNTGNGPTYGSTYSVYGAGGGTKYGVFSNVNNTANTTAYSGYFEVLGTGTGTKYGIYAKATGSGSLYAAVLDGKVGIGTSTVSTNEILEINGRTRIRRNALPAGIWLNNNANGNSASDGAFVGMNNETPGSESVGFWLNNSFKLTVDRVGNTNVEGEINRPPTGASNLVPIAYGSINANGTINSQGSTNNFSVTNPSVGVYNISITNESYIYTNYTVVASLSDTDFGFIKTSSVNSALQIKTADTSGTLANRGFCFVVYKE